MFDWKIYILSVLALVYPFILMAVVRAIRFIGKNKSAKEGERRGQYPRLRLIINILTLVPMLAIFLLFVMGMLWLVQTEEIDFFSKINLIGFLGVSYSIVMIAVLRFVRFTNKNKSPGKDAERRRQKPRLRFALDALGLLPIMAMGLFVIVGVWWFVTINDMVLDAHIRVIGILSVVYFFLMIAAVSLFQFIKKNSGRIAHLKNDP